MRQTMILGLCVLFSMSLRLVVGAGPRGRDRDGPLVPCVSREGSWPEGVAPPSTPSTRRALASFTPWAPAAARSRWTDKEGATSRTHTLRAAQLLGNEAQRALGGHLPHAFPTELFAV